MGDKNAYGNLVRKPEGNTKLEGPRHGEEGYIEVILKWVLDVGLDCVEWIDQAVDRKNRVAVVSAVMNNRDVCIVGEHNDWESVQPWS
jgi:hypothetical protein